MIRSPFFVRSFGWTYSVKSPVRTMGGVLILGGITIRFTHVVLEWILKQFLAGNDFGLHFF